LRWINQNYCYDYKKACDLGKCDEYNKLCKNKKPPTENYQEKSQKLSDNYASIVIGSFGAKANAERQKQTLVREGFDNINISKVANVYRVSVLVSGSKEKVQEVHKRVKVYHKSAWISYN
jgi:cell division protein FtsN